MQAEEGCRPLDEGDLGLPVRDLGLHISRVKQRTQHGDGFDLEFNVRASPPHLCALQIYLDAVLKDPRPSACSMWRRKVSQIPFLGTMTAPSSLSTVEKTATPTSSLVRSPSSSRRGRTLPTDRLRVYRSS